LKQEFRGEEQDRVAVTRKHKRVGKEQNCGRIKIHRKLQGRKPVKSENGHVRRRHDVRKSMTDDKLKAKAERGRIVPRLGGQRS